MANVKLQTDSPLSRRIVRSFLDFLNSVDPAPGVDQESLEVARECLTEVFKLDSPSVDGQTKPDSLIDIFKSIEVSNHLNTKSDITNKATAVDAPSSSSAQNVAGAKMSEASKSLGEDTKKEPDSPGVSKDELFGQFFAALEKIHYFRTMPDGSDDPSQLDKASCLFHDALNEMERSGSQAFDRKNLAETLKCQGNRAMQSKLYSDAIELYSFAIALWENNAVFYCNRAAAYTQIRKYAEAIRDCLKSSEIDPNYSKAYSRLGLAYYAQGNYSDAIEKGFKKALQLDPNNESVKENIRVAEQKLREEMQRQNQNTSSSRNNGAPPTFSMPFNTNAMPTDLASMLMNMAAANMQPGQPSQNGPAEDSSSGEPGIRIGGNINLNMGDQMPEDITGALRSMMEMLSGQSSQGNPHDTNTTNGRSSEN